MVCSSSRFVRRNSRISAAESAVILFADETSVRTDYHVSTTWAPVGCTPVVTGPAVRHAVKMVSAVSARSECSFEVHEGSMNADRFTGFLQKLLHDFDRPVFLVVDGTSFTGHGKSGSTWPAPAGGRNCSSATTRIRATSAALTGSASCGSASSSTSTSLRRPLPSRRDARCRAWSSGAAKTGSALASTTNSSNSSTPSQALATVPDDLRKLVTP